jgi:alpha-L-fucosidase
MGIWLERQETYLRMSPSFLTNFHIEAYMECHTCDGEQFLLDYEADHIDEEGEDDDFD